MRPKPRVTLTNSNLVSNSIKFTETGSVRIVTKLLYPRMQPTPATELDDPLRQAAVNLKNQQKLEEGERMERWAKGDVEKGSIMLDERRVSHGSVGSVKETHEEKKRRKAVVRVEIHDTGVGLKKEDVIE